MFSLSPDMYAEISVVVSGAASHVIHIFLFLGGRDAGDAIGWLDLCIQLFFILWFLRYM
jgi:hypothetical protein